ncbi:glutamine synthetase/guanido kinase [Ascodesmis nigricans]|uniref:Glutamine synthetase n=1 Tax=Ascodesmis nigricans TaxID=341454 RepID=A0A4S2MZV9_9PEZI|nr:glutamine synthetase/guanido kinase [Ascodesmis nigricans]
MAARVHTVESITEELAEDGLVKLAGIDVDGILRGKVVSKDKFLSIIESGFGFCSVIFGWDMHDKTYQPELLVSNAENGYRDMLAKVDLQTFRRIPWETHPQSKKGTPFFLLQFVDPNTNKPIPPCPRNLLDSMVKKVAEHGWEAMAGAEYEFFNFRETPKSLEAKGADLEHITPGMFGYSIMRPVQNQEYYYGVYDSCKNFGIDLEGWHTESGPGVLEAALEFCDAKNMADKASLFKYTTKAIGSKYKITPCFMAKPVEGLPGNSGHMHISLADAQTGANLFARDEKNPNPFHEDLAYISDLGCHFLAGILDGLPSIMPIFAPTINSYKRLVENFWAPVTVSWGLEHRAASIRVIGPPLGSKKSTRFEIRTPGADTNPHYVLSAIIACGLRGIQKKLPMTIPPLAKGKDASDGERLPRNLAEAVNTMHAKGSVARDVFGNDFVDHYCGTRRHELMLWNQAVTDWEVKRYIETV